MLPYRIRLTENLDLLRILKLPQKNTAQCLCAFVMYQEEHRLTFTATQNSLKNNSLKKGAHHEKSRLNLTPN